MSRRLHVLLFVTTAVVLTLTACSPGESGADVAPSATGTPAATVAAASIPPPEHPPATAGTPEGSGTPAPVDGNQISVLNSLPGPAHKGTACVKVGDQSDIRVGRLAVGNFASARSAYAQQGGKGKATVPLYVIPARTSAHKAEVRLSSVDGSGPARKISTSARQKADSWTYFAVQLPVPAAGAYRLTATSGGASACFEISFGQ
jgi:hypothetical protein